MVELSNPKYTYTKRGVFYFSKKIPTDLRHHYKKPIITQSLRTKSKMDAEKNIQSSVRTVCSSKSVSISQ